MSDIRVVLDVDQTTVALSTTVVNVEVAKGLRGDPGEGVHVQPTDPGMLTPGLWVQTGLGDGTDFTFWIEDGT